MTTVGLQPAKRPTVYRQPVVWLVGVVLAGLWLLLGPPTPDLAAQVYRADLFHRIGFAVWDASWYAGHHMPGYSLLFPPLGALLGARVVGALAALASLLLFERLIAPYFSRRAVLYATLWFAAAATCDLLIGRITFSVGVTFGLAAALALSRGHPWVAAALGVACAAGSPVAGVFASLVGAAVVVGGRRRDGIPLTIAPIGLVLVLAVLFPEGGRQPFVSFQILVPLIACGIVFLLTRPEDKILRAGILMYVAGCVIAMVLPTPVGDNVLRLGSLLAGPLIALLWIDRAPGAGRVSQRWLIVASVIFIGWQIAGPVREVIKGVDDPSTHQSYYTPLADWITAHGGPGTRIEVPFSRGHWEAAYLAPRVPLARGWETQLDIRYGEFFYESGRSGVTPSRYHAWLRNNGVEYVALPDADLDRSSKAEGALIRSRPDYLTPVWSNEHWQVYRVTDPEPMASDGASITQLKPDGFTLSVPRAGDVRVRLRPTQYFIVTTKNACVLKSPDGWTHLRVAHPGTVRVHAGFTLDDVLGADDHCKT
jgi:hypothetical protein